MNYRRERVSSLFREELSKMILRDFEFPDTLVTLTDVDVDAKMDRAVVWVSVFPSEKAEHAVRVLNSASFGLTKTLLRKVNIRPMPELHFEIDHGPENAARVEKELLRDNDDSHE